VSGAVPMPARAGLGDLRRAFGGVCLRRGKFGLGNFWVECKRNDGDGDSFETRNIATTLFDIYSTPFSELLANSTAFGTPSRTRSSSNRRP